VGEYSDILYAPPSFVEGMARIFDFSDVLTEYNTSPTPRQANAAALRSDWRAVGEDMRAAISRVAEQAPIVTTPDE